MKKKLLSVLICAAMIFSGLLQAVLPSVVYGDDKIVIYCSPEGSSENEGTKASPKDIRTAIASAAAGTLIYLLDGTYTLDSQITIDKAASGTADNYIRLSAETAGKVILDFSSETYAGTNDNDRGLQINADYWHVYGIKFYGAADNGMLIAGSHNIIENCVFEGNRDSGLQISRASSATAKTDWPANNLIKNCTSFNNMDITGENADGFASKLTCGDGNVFDGCIAYNNVDDGWDLYTKAETGAIGTVTLVNCIAFRNGQTTDGNFTAEADGNGFKLGGEAIGVNHVVVNCIAFENKNHGFTDNSNPGIITVINCTAFNNSLENGEKSNFDFARQFTSNNYFENLLSFTTNDIKSDKYRGTAVNSVFYGGSGSFLQINTASLVNTKLESGYTGDAYSPGVSVSDFVSIESPSATEDIHSIWRNDDGSVNTAGFLQLSADSALRTLGTDSSVLGSALGDGISMEAVEAKTADDILEFETKPTTSRLSKEERDKLLMTPVEEHKPFPIIPVVAAVSGVIAVIVVALILLKKAKKN